jgi:hypothetical protein
MSQPDESYQIKFPPPSDNGLARKRFLAYWSAFLIAQNNMPVGNAVITSLDTARKRAARLGIGQTTRAAQAARS